MSELHKFLFEGLPVRGMIVRLTDAWAEVLQRRNSNSATGAHPAPVQECPDGPRAPLHHPDTLIRQNDFHCLMKR